MSKEATFQDLSFHLPPGKQDLWRWLYTELRGAILDGRLKPGARMPSTRNLGKQYSLSRGTVVAAFDQLQAEGYTHTEVGQEPTSPRAFRMDSCLQQTNLRLSRLQRRRLRSPNARNSF